MCCKLENLQKPMSVLDLCTLKNESIPIIMWELTVICKVYLPSYYHTSFEEYFKVVRENGCELVYQPQVHFSTMSYLYNHHCKEHNRDSYSAQPPYQFSFLPVKRKINSDYRFLGTNTLKWLERTDVNWSINLNTILLHVKTSTANYVT
jgi:hypothetical protein